MVAYFEMFDKVMELNKDNLNKAEKYCDKYDEIVGIVWDNNKQMFALVGQGNWE